MTRQQRRSKSQYHNKMKKLGYRWYKKGWWEQWRFKFNVTVPIYHSDHEEAK